MWQISESIRPRGSNNSSSAAKKWKKRTNNFIISSDNLFLIYRESLLLQRPRNI
jgi:hypothetical protein